MARNMPTEYAHRACVHTLEETAQYMGLSKVGVLKIENRALEKLRREFKKRGLSFQDLITCGMIGQKRREEATID